MLKKGVSLISIHIATMCGETSFSFTFFIYNIKSMFQCVKKIYTSS